MTQNALKTNDCLAPRPGPLKRLLDSLWSFHRNQRGSGLVLVVFVGMGIDYLVGLSFKARWDTAADAASIAAVKTAETYVTANGARVSGSALTSAAISAGIAQAQKVFASDAGASVQTETVTPNLTMTVSGATFTATASYAGSVRTYFGGLVGTANIAVQGSATASGSLNTYINCYIVVDTSESMGVGSTRADMQNLFNRTEAYGNATDGEPGCVLACHVTTVDNNGTPQTYSNEYLAHNISPYINLRIDAAKAARQAPREGPVGPTGPNGRRSGGIAPNAQKIRALDVLRR